MTTTNLPDTQNKPILITSGEPAGIGMDIILKLASNNVFSKIDHPIIVTACHHALTQRAKYLQQNDKLNQPIQWQTIQSIEEIHHGDASNFDYQFYCLDTPTNETVEVGLINETNAQMVLNQLKLAHHLAETGQVAGIVTAPIQKSALITAGLTLPDGSLFKGHTEYFMQLSGIDGIHNKVVMMLANTKLRVALVTTHIPLAQVASAITHTEVKQTVQIVLDSMHNQFHIDHPKILVCGLNPHAGESGHLGTEEIEVINPVLQTFIDKGHDISLAMPADTLFTQRYLEACDVVIAMYHDQGLPVLKSHGFGDSVNITLGLPYIRTSVDHGTALDLAGTGRASSDSLEHAINMLVNML